MKMGCLVTKYTASFKIIKALCGLVAMRAYINMTALDTSLTSAKNKKQNQLQA